MEHQHVTTVEGQSLQVTVKAYAEARWNELGHEISSRDALKVRSYRRGDTGLANPFTWLCPDAPAPDWEAQAQAEAARDPIISDTLAWLTNGRIGRRLQVVAAIATPSGIEERDSCQKCGALWGNYHEPTCPTLDAEPPFSPVGA